MGRYKIDLTKDAFLDLKKLEKSEPQAYKKAISLIQELEEHPTSGTGKPKPLGNNRAGEWSRRINQKHRLIYRIDEEKVVVLVLSTYGHYD